MSDWEFQGSQIFSESISCVLSSLLREQKVLLLNNDDVRQGKRCSLKPGVWGVTLRDGLQSAPPQLRVSFRRACLTLRLLSAPELCSEDADRCFRLEQRCRGSHPGSGGGAPAPRLESHPPTVGKEKLGL